MVVGYAAFQTRLEIKETSKVTSNWDIRITNVTEGEATGSAENTIAPKWDALTATMEANLYEKGDAMEYDVTIENKGTIDAKLNDVLTNLENSNSDAVIITFSGYTKGEVLKAGSSKLIHVKIEYNPNYDGGETSGEIDIEFDYGQNNNEENNPDNQYLLTYDYSTNGGTNNTYTFTGLTQGTTYDVMVRATSESGKQITTIKETTTASLVKPTFTEDYEGEVLITYPSGCGSTLTCTYQKDDGEVVEVTTETVEVPFTEDGNIVGTVSDGISTVSSSYTV